MTPAADLPRLAENRLRRLAWLLDNSIPLPGGYRIGIDGLIGLIPGLGDAAGALLSSYIVVEAGRLGAPKSLLLRMAFNVFVETVIGTIPFAGDLFDFVYKANARNVRLLERYARDTRGQRKSNQAVAAAIIVGVLVVVFLIVWAIVALLSALFQAL
ncbi:MAG: DUF4112 domain-containing protein [Gammaproteobacteria bacterium]